MSLKGQPISKFEIELIFNFQENNVQTSFACTEIQKLNHAKTVATSETCSPKSRRIVNMNNKIMNNCMSVRLGLFR